MCFYWKTCRDCLSPSLSPGPFISLNTSSNCVYYWVHLPWICLCSQTPTGGLAGLGTPKQQGTQGWGILGVVRLRFFCLRVFFPTPFIMWCPHPKQPGLQHSTHCSTLVQKPNKTTHTHTKPLQQAQGTLGTSDNQGWFTTSASRSILEEKYTREINAYILKPLLFPLPSHHLFLVSPNQQFINASPWQQQTDLLRLPLRLGSGFPAGHPHLPQRDFYIKPRFGSISTPAQPKPGKVWLSLRSLPFAKSTAQ